MQPDGETGAAARTRETAWEGYRIVHDEGRRASPLTTPGGGYRVAGPWREPLDRPCPCTPAESAQFYGHLETLERISGGSRAAHIVEDGVVFSRILETAIAGIMLRPKYKQYDVVFLDARLAPNLSELRRHHQMFKDATDERGEILPGQLRLLEFGKGHQGSIGSYLVEPRGAGKLANILGAEWRRGPTAPLEELLRAAIAARQIHAAYAFPFVTASRPVSEDAFAAEGDNPALRMLSAVFFADRDLMALRQRLTTLDREDTPRAAEAAAFYGRILRYYLSQTNRT